MTTELNLEVSSRRSGRWVIHKTQNLSQPWIHSAPLDLTLILGPALLVSMIALLFHEEFERYSEMPVWAWFVLIVGIDVAHVYGTLFRTYFQPGEFNRNRTLFTMVPLACWLVGAMLYSIDGMLFWRILAYLAVFHFIRQQYGFMAIYTRKEPTLFQRFRSFDCIMIYASMLLPLLFWHSSLPRQFNWFIEGDFIPVEINVPSWLLFALYGLVMLAYLIKEVWVSRKCQFINIPKNLLILGTALSWSIGIMVFDNDFIFTATNVLSHGIPYLALIWVYGRRSTSDEQPSASSRFPYFFSTIGIPLLLIFLCGLAFLEEGLWDALVWRNHTEIFSLFSNLPLITDKLILAWLIPLLALPQATHYVLDGFIWRMKPEISNQWTSLLDRPYG